MPTPFLLSISKILRHSVETVNHSSVMYTIILIVLDKGTRYQWKNP